MSAQMRKTLRIDLVSDVVCPWCAIGLASLEQALRQLQGEVEAELHVQPFELDPTMPAEGADVAETLKRKYGMSDAQLAENQARIRDRGAEVGFRFDFNARSRTWNTFDAHRLLHWAAAEAPARQLPLKRALLVANFSEGLDVSDHAVLAEVAAGVGLDPARAREPCAAAGSCAPIRTKITRHPASPCRCPSAAPPSRLPCSAPASPPRPPFSPDPRTDAGA